MLSERGSAQPRDKRVGELRGKYFQQRFTLLPACLLPACLLAVFVEKPNTESKCGMHLLCSLSREQNILAVTLRRPVHPDAVLCTLAKQPGYHVRYFALAAESVFGKWRPPIDRVMCRTRLQTPRYSKSKTISRKCKLQSMSVKVKFIFTDNMFFKKRASVSTLRSGRVMDDASSFF